MKDKGFYTTGEFAKMAGVTIRTIRYYDSKGLLKPHGHNSAGHRIYSKKEYIQLEKILALKYLGMSLNDVQLMEKEEFEKRDFKKSLKLQRKIINNKLNHMKMVLNAIQTAEALLETDEKVDVNKTLEMIKILQNEKEVLQRAVDLSSLNEDIKLQDKFGSSSQGWYEWVFEKMSLKPNSKILEIGCGNGALWFKNIHRVDGNLDITLTEICEDMIKESFRNLSKYKKNFKFKIENPTQLSFLSQEFDVVIANHILFYMKDLNSVLSEIKRVLKPGGSLFCSTIGKGHMKELEKIMSNFNKKIWIFEDKLTDNFGLENGKNLLEHYFTKIDTLNYKDQMIVDDVEGLLEYIYSVPGNILEIVEMKKKEFEDYIEKILTQKNRVTITNQSGMFRCFKEEMCID